MPEKTIKIRKNLRLGDLEAETDIDLLKKCFVDNGNLSLLRDVSAPESIVVGRTGSGKSALLLELADTEAHSRILDPHEVSIRYLESSDIVQFFTELGIKLDLFYRILWRHVLTVEFLKLRYDLRNASEGDSLWDRLIFRFEKDHVKKAALQYFREWGDKFWLDTSEHIQEITNKLTKDLEIGLGGKFKGLALNLMGAKSLSEESRTEVKQLATKVVSRLQIKKLSDVLELLEQSAFSDSQKRYYLMIDKLDEDWADTPIRCRVIRALIEEIKTFRKLENVKIIIALRKDLLEIVFDKTRDAGFQQEKYESYILDLHWTDDELSLVIRKRINEIFRSQYTKSEVQFEDVFPPKAKEGKSGQLPLSFILERTLKRPRDVLQFSNECFRSASGRERVSWRAINAAEVEYSKKRLKSLFEEWKEIYPDLNVTVEILRGLKESFTRSTFSKDRLNQIVSGYAEESIDPCAVAVLKYCGEIEGKMTEGDVVTEIIKCFHKIGILGLKIGPTEPYTWVDFDSTELTKGEIKRVTKIKIHKMVHRVLGILSDSQGYLS